MTFGYWFKQFRLERQIGLRELANKLRMDSGNLSKLESGKHSPPNTFKKIKSLARHLKLSETELNILRDSAYLFHVDRIAANLNLDHKKGGG
jgi:transcriptional regulator with XRE-family HTH domain